MVSDGQRWSAMVNDGQRPWTPRRPSGDRHHTRCPPHKGRQMPMPANIPIAISVIPLDDPVVERHGFGPQLHVRRGRDASHARTDKLWLYRRVGVMVLTSDHTEVELAELGRELGVGARVGRNSPVVKALRRLGMFRRRLMERSDLGSRHSRHEGDARDQEDRPRRPRCGRRPGLAASSDKAQPAVKLIVW
jgi:hypothetical protein